jgi:hypothetical protein
MTHTFLSRTLCVLRADAYRQVIADHLDQYQAAAGKTLTEVGAVLCVCRGACVCVCMSGWVVYIYIYMCVCVCVGVGGCGWVISRMGL